MNRIPSSLLLSMSKHLSNISPTVLCINYTIVQITTALEKVLLDFWRSDDFWKVFFRWSRSSLMLLRCFLSYNQIMLLICIIILVESVSCRTLLMVRIVQVWLNPRRRQRNPLTMEITTRRWVSVRNCKHMFFESGMFSYGSYVIRNIYSSYLGHFKSAEPWNRPTSLPGKPPRTRRRAQEAELGAAVFGECVYWRQS